MNKDNVWSSCLNFPITVSCLPSYSVCASLPHSLTTWATVSPLLPDILHKWYSAVWSYYYYYKILKSYWLSTVLISALIGQYASCLSNWMVGDITRALNWLFFSLLGEKFLEFLVFRFKKESLFSQILLKLWLTGNRTSCRPIRSVIILVIKQIGLPLRGRPILLITRMITDQIGLHSVLLPLRIKC